jgi:hypothetical protein
MANSKITTTFLLIINLALALFIIQRSSGGVDLAAPGEKTEFVIREFSSPEAPPPDTLLLCGYERVNDMWNMYPQGGEYELSLTDRHVTQGSRSLLIDKVRESNIEMALIHFPKNWEPYDLLLFDIYNGADDNATVRLRIGNYYDEVRFYVDSQKYAESFVLVPGANTITVPLADVRNVLNVDVFRKSLHFNFPADRGEELYLDNLRLVRDED